MKTSLLLLMILACAAVTRAQGAAAPVPTAKIAVIYSEAFRDPKTGIARFAAAVNQLKAEFKPLQDELDQTAAKLNAMQAEITKMQSGTPAASPQQIQAKIDQFDDQKKAYDRKGEDVKARFDRRSQELMGPLDDDVFKALDAFGKAHGITMYFDGSRMPVVYMGDGVDVTKAFIAEYNAKYPPTTTAATPRP